MISSKMIVKRNHFIFKQPGDNSFGAQIHKIISLLFHLSAHAPGSNYVFNLKNLRFVHPLFILALAAYKEILQRDGTDIEIVSPIESGCNDYIDKIHFPCGIRPDHLSSWATVLQSYEMKNYLPIINFPAATTGPYVDLTNNLLSLLNRLIQSNLSLDNDFQNAVQYLISEITDNVIQHSGNDRGWFMFQYYPTTLYLDICIIDTGKTILGSYHDSGLYSIDSDVIAVEKALTGISTKSKERGTGLRTSRAISMDGLAGDFLLWSGSAMYYNNTITQLPVKWHGTIVAMRIKRDIERFSIYNFV